MSNLSDASRKTRSNKYLVGLENPESQGWKEPTILPDQSCAEHQQVSFNSTIFFIKKKKKTEV